MLKNTRYAKARESCTVHETVFTKTMMKKRLEKNYPQSKMSELTNLSPSYLNNIERGTHTPSITAGIKICKVLDIPIDQFLGYIYDIRHEQLLEEIKRECKENRVKIPEVFNGAI